MNSVSGCCLKPVLQGQKVEYPFSPYHPQVYDVDYCEGCGKEVEDPILVFECCGEEACECEEDCPTCGGSGFSGYGTGYDAVCDTCAGNKVVLNHA